MNRDHGNKGFAYSALNAFDPITFKHQLMFKSDYIKLFNSILTTTHKVKPTQPAKPMFFTPTLLTRALGATLTEPDSLLYIVL